MTYEEQIQLFLLEFEHTASKVPTFGSSDIALLYLFRYQLDTIVAVLAGNLEYCEKWIDDENYPHILGDTIAKVFRTTSVFEGDDHTGCLDQAVRALLNDKNSVSYYKAFKHFVKWKQAVHKGADSSDAWEDICYVKYAGGEKLVHAFKLLY